MQPKDLRETVATVHLFHRQDLITNAAGDYHVDEVAGIWRFRNNLSGEVAQWEPARDEWVFVDLR